MTRFTEPLNYSTCDGTLTINSVAMQGPAWSVLDVMPLYIPNATRGRNVIIPGASGQRAYARYVDQGRFSLPMVIMGEYNRLGVAYASEWNGLQTNLAYLYTNVFAPPASPTATVAATLVTPGGVTLNANVQVESFQPINPRTFGALIEGTLELIIPAGRFA